MNMPLPPAEELALIDRELAQLDARRMHLLVRRDWLLRLLAQPQQWPRHAGKTVTVAAEASAPGTQNVLLTLGAVLLAVAALAFTLVSWGSLGIGGRSAVLAAVTAAALAVPVELLRRGLRSTAESVGALALLLTVLDAYALHAAVLASRDPVGYAAAAGAVLAAVWAGYGRALGGRLRLPLPGALLVAQFPLPLAAVAAGAGPVGTGWALLATAALDAALAVAGSRTAWVPAAALGAGALLTGFAGSWSAAGAAEPALLLATAAVLGVAVTWREPRAWPAASAGAVAAVGALGSVVKVAPAARKGGGGGVWCVRSQGGGWGSPRPKAGGEATRWGHLPAVAGGRR